MSYDFCGWATRNDVLCSDGRTIRKGAFSDCDGKTVPLVYNHDHNSPFAVLGHALLEERDDGIYAYCSFNNTQQGLDAKEYVQHGDVVALSIYANQLKQRAKDVIHGMIREVSLVLAGANPEAYIEDVIEHDEKSGEGALIWTVSEDDNGIEMFHAEESEKKEDKEVYEETNDKNESKGEDKTVKEVFDTLNEEQKTAVYAIIGAALDNEKGDDEEDMKQNAFDTESQSNTTYLSHSDQKAIVERAKKLGTLREAWDEYAEGGTLAHSIDTTGMETAVGEQTYGFNDASMMFPDYKSLNNGFQWISRNMNWVNKVLGGTHKSAFSRIKSIFADITEDEARARGYLKGNRKKDEVFSTLKRTTDPQTIYKKQKLDRDDIIDITDFDVVSEIRGEMRLMLNEEIARAILIGDGRLGSSDDKIKEDRIRPIATDVPLFNTTVQVVEDADATDADTARDTIDAVIKARKHYKGSGNPTFFTTEDVITEMLLLEDGIGHKLYKTEQELATALRVREIVTVEPMEGHTITISTGENTTKVVPLIGIIVNLTDYNVGTNKGGEINMFDDFDIDFNQYKYLIETRMSGALVKPFSALTVVLNKAAS